jgi:hypothetical protein
LETDAGEAAAAAKEGRGIVASESDGERAWENLFDGDFGVNVINPVAVVANLSAVMVEMGWGLAQ